MILYSHSNKSYNNNYSERSFKIFSIALIVFLFIIGVFYIININDVSIKGEEFLFYEKKLRNLKELAQNLLVQKSEALAAKNIKEKISSLSLVESRNVEYLDILEAPLVFKR